MTPVTSFLLKTGPLATMTSIRHASPPLTAIGICCMTNTGKEPNMKEHLHIEFKLRVGVRKDVECGAFVSWCPTFGIYSQAESKEGAFEAKGRTLRAHFRGCYARGELAELLKKLQFEIAGPSETTATRGDEMVDVHKVDEPYSYDMINVPFDLVSGTGPAEVRC